MDYVEAMRIIDIFKRLGTKAVTITGGGEPLCYPYIKKLIEYFHASRIKIGLVTNGLLLSEIDPETLSCLTWCRISSGDDREFSHSYATQLSGVIQECPQVDWAFSHVVSEKPNIDTIIKIIRFANLHLFTHVRLVSDLCQPENVDLIHVASQLDYRLQDDSLVIYQCRQQYTRGGDCYICYLKPVVGADAKIYTCCGAQYALVNSSRDMPEQLCLGDARDIPKVIQNSNKPFDGSICVKCYYKNYNDLLAGLLSETRHREFV